MTWPYAALLFFGGLCIGLGIGLRFLMRGER